MWRTSWRTCPRCAAQHKWRGGLARDGRCRPRLNVLLNNAVPSPPLPSHACLLTPQYAVPRRCLHPHANVFSTCTCVALQARQTMLFSATVPKWVKKLVKQYLNDPIVSVCLGWYCGHASLLRCAAQAAGAAPQVPSSSRSTLLKAPPAPRLPLLLAAACRPDLCALSTACSLPLLACPRTCVPQDIDLVGEGQTGKMAEGITALAVQVCAPRCASWGLCLACWAGGGKMGAPQPRCAARDSPPTPPPALQVQRHPPSPPPPRQPPPPNALSLPSFPPRPGARRRAPLGAGRPPHRVWRGRQGHRVHPDQARGRRGVCVGGGPPAVRRAARRHEPARAREGAQQLPRPQGGWVGGWVGGWPSTRQQRTRQHVPPAGARGRAKRLSEGRRKRPPPPCGACQAGSPPPPAS